MAVRVAVRLTPGEYRAFGVELETRLSEDLTLFKNGKVAPLGSGVSALNFREFSISKRLID